jgi:hypothetical protein
MLWVLTMYSKTTIQKHRVFKSRRTAGLVFTIYTGKDSSAVFQDVTVYTKLRTSCFGVNLCAEFSREAAICIYCWNVFFNSCASRRFQK